MFYLILSVRKHVLAFINLLNYRTLKQITHYLVSMLCYTILLLTGCTSKQQPYCIGADIPFVPQSEKGGVVYKNVIGTYLHGPLLPKNPQLADWLITQALRRKYGADLELEPLDDTQEKEANDYIYRRFVK